MSIDTLFDELCLRWAQEADVVAQQLGTVEPRLVLLPRDVTADEVAIKLDGLRGNLAERADALVAELRPTTSKHDPAGLVFLAQLRLGGDPSVPEQVVVYVSLGQPDLRRALGYRFADDGTGTKRLERLPDDPPVAMFAWLDALLRP